MSTILDSLIIEIGLDPKKLNQGQREAINSFKKTVEESKKQGDILERNASRVADSFNAVRRTILGVGALIGINSGFKTLAKDITQSDAATGRLAYTLNTTTREYSKWRQATVLAGGTAEGFAQSVSSLSADLQNWSITGESNIVGYLRSLGVVITDDNDKLLGIFDVIRNISREVNKTTSDPGLKATMFRQLGIDDGTIQLLIRGEGAMNKLLAASEKIGVVTEKNAEQAAELVKQWSLMSGEAMNLARVILNYLSPSLLELLKSTRAWFAEMAKGQFISKDSLLGKVMGGMSIRQAVAEHDWGRGRLAKIGGDGVAPLPSGERRVFANNAEREAFIRAEAVKRRGDPDYAARVFRGEGAAGFAGDDNSSFGAFQLHYGGVSPKFPAKGLGDEFTKRTGLDARDPANEAEGIKFALDEAYKKGGRGWAPWYGAARMGVGQFDGIPRGPGPTADGGRSSTTTNQTHINSVNVYTQATDANGMARDVRAAFQDNSLAGQAQGGPN